jgi:hypothetical protein
MVQMGGQVSVMVCFKRQVLSCPHSHRGKLERWTQPQHYNKNLHMNRAGNSCSVNQICIKLEDLLLCLCLILIREEILNVRHDYRSLRN